jgi:hypothetical protein
VNIYLNRNDEQFGPYSLDQVQGYLDSGTFTLIDSAWYEGGIGWTTISNIPGIVVGDEKLRQHLVPPFEAYAGSDPYIFVSYAHADGQLVFREILRLHEAGYRIWYDEGIEPGKDWPEHIAKAVIECDLFLMFTSPRSAASENCRNEVNLALNRKKKFLAVYLEETDLPPGLELRMGDLQAIHKFKMPDATYRKKVFVGLEKMLGETGRDMPEGEDPVAVAMAIEVVADYLSVPGEDEEDNGYFPETEEAPSKSKGKWIFLAFAVMICAAWFFFLDQFKNSSEREQEVIQGISADVNQSKSGQESASEHNASTALSDERREISEQMAEAKRVLAQIEQEKQKQLDLLAESDKQQKARSNVENSIGIENYLAALEQAEQLQAYEGDELLALKKVAAGQAFLRNEDDSLNGELLFDGPNEVWEKVKAKEFGLQPKNTQSEFLALSALANIKGVSDVWVHKQFECKTTPISHRFGKPRYETKKSFIRRLFSFGQVQEERTILKFDEKGLPVTGLSRLVQQGDFFGHEPSPEFLLESLHKEGLAKGDILEDSTLTRESRFMQERFAAFLNEKEVRVEAPLLELIDLLVADETLSLPFKAFIHDRLATIIRLRGHEWGLGLTADFFDNHEDLKVILDDGLDATTWMNPEPGEDLLEELESFYQELGQRAYVEEAKIRLAFVQSLSRVSFRLVGRVDEFGRARFLDPENPPSFSWCVDREEDESLLQRFNGFNALPFSPLIGTDSDLGNLLDQAFGQAGDDVRDNIGAIEDMLPFHYLEE